ncbi:hypothetical protein ACFQEV_00810 [Halopelagius fulvigenes]|uniref:Uncharacterized protein n=1 Tax=Halopelagius fulvigenes TaxID=1198324 RepID=A0ABD5TXJ9_9EURY
MRTFAVASASLLVYVDGGDDVDESAFDIRRRYSEHQFAPCPPVPTSITRYDIGNPV